MDEKLINIIAEEVAKEVGVEENSTPEVQEEIIYDVAVEVEEPIVIDISESMGWVSGDNRYHNSLLGIDYPNQHPITAISGLREELDQIEALKTVESDKFNVANYYEWKDAAYDTHGYFVSLVPGESKIQICNGSDIFGVSVESAGFVGGQNKPSRDDSYGLIVTSGLVDVRCELDVNVGDYVVSNAYGYAKKSNSDYGYKVIAQENKGGVEYAVIMLGVQADVTNAMGEELDAIEKRVSVNEQNIVSAINVSNQAYNKAESAANSASVSKEAVEEALKDILGFGETLDEMEKSVASSSIISAQAKAIADGAATSAASMHKEAVEKAKEALDDGVKLRNELTETVNTMNDNLSEAVEDLKGLKNDLTPLATWPEGSDIESATGYAGFVARADADSSILGTMVGRKGENGETLAGFIQEAEETRATVRGIVSYEYTDKNGNPVTGAAGLMAQVDETKSEVSAVANRSFTKEDGTVVTGLAGLNAQVDENESNVSLVANRVAGKYTVLPELVAADKRDNDKLYSIHNKLDGEETETTKYYYKDGDWTYTTTWNDLQTEGKINTSTVYYVAATKKYKYYEEDTWKETDDPHTAGLPASISGIQVVADDNSASINSLVSWQGTTNTTMARIEQKADANGAYIQSTVVNIDKYSVGPYSQAYGFTLEQAENVLEEGMIYVPTEDKIDDNKEIYKYSNEAIVVEEWDETDKDESKVYRVKDTEEYWVREYSGGAMSWIEKTGEPVCDRQFVKGYLYQWSKTNGRGRWITVDKDYGSIENEENADCTSGINTSSMAVYFSTTEIAMGDGENNYGYWYTNGTEIESLPDSTATYEPYTLYKWDAYIDESGATQCHWVAVATLAGNYKSRAVSQIRQSANSIELSVTALNGAYSGIQTQLDSDSAKVNSIAAWPSDAGSDKFNMAILKQHSDGNSAHLALAAVRDVDGSGTIEVDELGGAKIVLADDGDGSYIQIDANHINFTADDYSVLSENITLNANQITFQTGDFGGRNLILNSSSPTTTHVAEYAVFQYSKVLEANTNYTISFDIQIDADANVDSYGVYLRTTDEDFVLIEDNISKDITRYTKTFQLTQDQIDAITADQVESSPKAIWIGVNGDGESETVTFSNAKLEQGIIATDWTPAPEDSPTFSEVNSMIDMAVDSIDLGVYAKIADVDGQISTVESKIALGIKEENGTKYAYLNANADKIKFDATKTIEISATNFTLDADGNIEATSGKIANYEIDGNLLYSNKVTDEASNSGRITGLYSGDYNGYTLNANFNKKSLVTPTVEVDGEDKDYYSSVRFFAGGSRIRGVNMPATGKFVVLEDGSLYANDAEIRGNITATGGSIGEFTIQDGKIYSGISSMNPEFGSGVYIGSDGIHIQHAVNGGFTHNHITLDAKDGTLSANNVNFNGGQIGSWIIEDSRIRSSIGVQRYYEYSDSTGKHSGQGYVFTILSSAGICYDIKESSEYSSDTIVTIDSCVNIIFSTQGGTGGGGSSGADQDQM